MQQKCVEVTLLILNVHEKSKTTEKIQMGWMKPINMTLVDGVEDPRSCGRSYLRFCHFQLEPQTHTAVWNPSALRVLLPSTVEDENNV